MNEDLYNYNPLYGNGLAYQSATPTSAYSNSLAPTSQARLLSLSQGAAPAGVPVIDTDKVTPPSATPSWMPSALGLGTLGLGLASFLDQRKTAGLQRDALRQNLQVSREHQAARKALGASWNQGWSN